VFAQDHKSKQLLFASLKALVIALQFIVKLSKRACQELASRWRVQYLAEDAARCRMSSQGTCLADCSCILAYQACCCPFNGMTVELNAKTHLPIDLVSSPSPGPLS
jgi:hypothetical protein